MDVERSKIEQLVRIVIAEVFRSLGPDLPKASGCECNGDCPCSEKAKPASPAGQVDFKGRLLSENQLVEFSRSGYRTVWLPERCLVTPLARDRADDLGIRIEFRQGNQSEKMVDSSGKKCLAVIAGMCSRSEEKALLETARSCGWNVRIEAVAGNSYNDLANTVRCTSALLESGECQRAVLLDENIFRISQLLNSECSAKPAICWDEKSAVDIKCRDDCNFLLISNRLLGLNMLGRIVRAWLKEE